MIEGLSLPDIVSDLDILPPVSGMWARVCVMDREIECVWCV